MKGRAKEERPPFKCIDLGLRAGAPAAAAKSPVLALGALPLVLRQLLEGQVQADEVVAAGAAVAQQQGRVVWVVRFVALGALEVVALHWGPLASLVIRTRLCSRRNSNLHSSSGA